jgi:hypothetical protein
MTRALIDHGSRLEPEPALQRLTGGYVAARPPDKIGRLQMTVGLVASAVGLGVAFIARAIQ